MLTADQARTLAEENKLFIESVLHNIEQTIGEAAISGEVKTRFVVYGHISLARRIVEELIVNGYRATARTEFGLLTEHRIDISWEHVDTPNQAA